MSQARLQRAGHEWLVPLTLLISAFAGAAVPQDFLPSGARIFVAACIATGVFAVAVFRPALCLYAVAILAVSGWTAPLFSAGVWDLRAFDVFYFPVVFGVLLRRPQQPPNRKQKQVSFYLIVALGVAGLSVIFQGFEAGSSLQEAAVSWIRLVQTFSLVLIFPLVPVNTEALQRAVAGAVCVAIIVSLILFVLDHDLPSLVTERAEGLAGPNSLGLISALLLIRASVLRPQLGWKTFAFHAGIAILGLAASKAFGASLAAALAIAIGKKTIRLPSSRILRLAVRSTALLAVAFVGFALARPQSMPFADGFNVSSSMQHVLVGRVGIRLVAENPLFGVGWSRSSNPEIIGSQEVVDPLRERFRDTNPFFFPDVTPTSVHNAYIQIAAETGLIGLIMIALCVAGIISVLGGGQTPMNPRDRVFSLWILAIAIWWNTSPLFGPQLDTLLFALCLGALAKGHLERDSLRHLP
jgi:O-antigen ligase